jgi:hypothetical protein
MEVLVGWSFRRFENSRNVEVPPRNEDGKVLFATVSIHLGKLCIPLKSATDVVRYDTSGKETRYWLKHKSEMKGLLRMLERVVNASAKLE